ncbi:YdeI/OmpD-associated family protein [Flavobacterium sp.]
MDWIYAAQKEETKANRIAKMLQMLDKGEML